MRQFSPKALATRAKILEAANDLFYAHGYNATGLDRIIAQAGVVKGNFYHHFRSKEELAEAVVTWHRDRVFEKIETRRLLEEPSALAAFVALLECMVSRSVCDGTEQLRGCLFGNFALELSAGSEIVREALESVFEEFRSVFRALLEKGIAQGEIREGLDLEETAKVTLSLMQGAILVDKTSQSQDQSASAIAFIEAYIRA